MRRGDLGRSRALWFLLRLRLMFTLVLTLVMTLTGSHRGVSILARGVIGVQNGDLEINTST
jgi:hypothetical protein